MKMSNLSKKVSRIFFWKKIKQKLWRLKNSYPMKMQVLSLTLNIYLAIETKTQENPGYHFSSIYN